MSFSTPVLFLIFNRPETTREVFKEISKLQPSYLYIAADGPRLNKAGEAELCAAAREMVTGHIDWPCEVKTLFRSENLGCGKAVSEAITWFFGHVEQGIILEDDCLPHQDFFYFCEGMLAKYQHNKKVMHIGGSNCQKRNVTGNNSYYFSNYIHIWGWATWKRAWDKYLFDIPVSDHRMKYILKAKFPDKLERGFWKNSFDRMKQHYIDTWDIQWCYSIFRNSGLGITPAVNLVSNIGFSANATHTATFNGTIPTASLNKNGIRHPDNHKINKAADRYTYKKCFQNGDTRLNRIKFKIGKKLPIMKRAYLKLIKPGIK